MNSVDKTAVATDPADFFRAHYVALRRFVAAETGAPDADVDDLVQDALLRAWRDRVQFRGDASPFTWICAIARNRVREFRRRHDQQRRTDAVLHALARLVSDEVPDNVLRSSEMGRRVRAALDALDADYAELLRRRYCDDQAVRAIADALAESEKAIESRLHRAREALRSLLQGGNDE